MRRARALAAAASEREMAATLRERAREARAHEDDEAERHLLAQAARTDAIARTHEMDAGRAPWWTRAWEGLRGRDLDADGGHADGAADGYRRLRPRFRVDHASARNARSGAE